MKEKWKNKEQKSSGVKVQRHAQKFEKTIDTEEEEELIGSFNKDNKCSSKYLDKVFKRCYHVKIIP